MMRLLLGNLSLTLAFALCGAGLAQDSEQEPAPKTFKVEFSPGEATSKLKPRFTPKGYPIELTAAEIKGLEGTEQLAGRVQLGPEAVRGEGLLLAVARSEPGKPYDLLFVDSNLDGQLTDETPITATPKLLREKTWSSFSDVVLTVPQSTAPDHAIAYPVSFWLVVETQEETPEVVRYTRTGFLQGALEIDGETYQVVLADGNNDAIFGNRDSWAISQQSADGELESPLWRPLGDFTWAGGKAWKLAMTGSDGASGGVTAINPGMTQAEDIESRDVLLADRRAKRAEKPIEFGDDYEAALKLAAESGKPCFVKFETDWCIPCKQMHALVFTAQDVVEAADGVICVTVDGDKRKDLAEQHQVAGYPTGIFLDASGQEISRFSGYQSVKKMTAAFGKLAE